jgi:DNA-binding IclR family transcriptional regulator
VERLVRESREQGYAFNPGMIVPGMSAVGVPILGVGSRCVASMSVAAIDARMVSDRRAQVVEWLTKEAHELETELKSVVGEATEARMRRLLPDAT